MFWSKKIHSESSTLVVAIDGEWENYNQDIVLYAGNINHIYHVSLGHLDEGEHTLCFYIFFFVVFLNFHAFLMSLKIINPNLYYIITLLDWPLN